MMTLRRSVQTVENADFVDFLDDNCLTMAGFEEELIT
jgi:hypothetical protein